MWRAFALEHIRLMYSSAENKQFCESQNPDCSAFCLCNSAVSGVSVCVCLSAFYNEDPFQSGLFLKVIWQSLAMCFLPESLGSEGACLALSVISNHFNLRWGYRLWNAPQAIFLKARWWKVREADYNEWNETQRKKCILNFCCAFTKPRVDSILTQHMFIHWPLHPVSGSLTSATCPALVSSRKHSRTFRSNSRKYNLFQ